MLMIPTLHLAALDPYFSKCLYTLVPALLSVHTGLYGGTPIFPSQT